MRRARDVALTLSLCLVSLSLIAFQGGSELPVGASFDDMLLALGVAVVLGHAVLFLLFVHSIYRTRRRPRASGEHQASDTAASDNAASDTASEGRASDARCTVAVYCVTATSTALAFTAQRVEWPRCPSWLYDSGANVHVLWHLGIFLAAHNANALLLFLEHPGGAVWARNARCPSWAWVLPTPRLTTKRGALPVPVGVGATDEMLPAI